MDRIKMDGLSGKVAELLDSFSAQAARTTAAAVKKAAVNAKNEIARTAPKDTGAYPKSWAVKDAEDSAFASKKVVYSKNRYRLTHLLENGYAKRNGGRVSGRPHIAPARERIEKQLISEIEKGIKNGT